jgi:hypothetical protein
MSGRLVLTAGINYRAPGDPEPVSGYWELTMSVAQAVNLAKKVFLVEKKYFGSSWGEPSYLRVASRSELKKYSFNDPETTGITYSSGYHLYLTSSVVSPYSSWDDAHYAYRHARARIKSLIGFDAETTLTSPLSIGIVGPVPYRQTGTAYTMYPLDSHKFAGSGGSPPYSYSIGEDYTGSIIEGSTGLFVANNSGNCEIVVQDSANGRATINVTIVEPSSPTSLEVFNV